LDAYKSTLEELGAAPPSHDIEPFTEKEAVSDLLCAIVDRDFMGKIDAAVPGDDPASKATRAACRRTIILELVLL